MSKINTDVIIDDKVYTISSEQDAAYVRQLAAYVNEKMDFMRKQQDYSKQPFGIKQMLLLMNIADDYFQMKEQAEVSRRSYEQQEAEFYNMKREMVNMQLAMARMKQEHACASSASVTSAQCPYLKLLQEQKTEKAEAAPASEKASAQIRTEEVPRKEEQKPLQQSAKSSAPAKTAGHRPPYEAFSFNDRK